MVIRGFRRFSVHLFTNLPASSRACRRREFLQLMEQLQRRSCARLLAPACVLYFSFAFVFPFPFRFPFPFLLPFPVLSLFVSFPFPLSLSFAFPLLVTFLSFAFALPFPSRNESAPCRRVRARGHETSTAQTRYNPSPNQERPRNGATNRFSNTDPRPPGYIHTRSIHGWKAVGALQFRQN